MTHAPAPSRLAAALPAGEAVTLRWVRTRSESLLLRRGVLQPMQSDDDQGAMVTAQCGGALGYAATADLSDGGIRSAVQRARSWAQETGRFAVDLRGGGLLHSQGSYRSPVREPWEALALAEKVALLQSWGAALGDNPRIIDWEAGLARIRRETLLVSNRGGHVEQETDALMPYLRATARRGDVVQTRSLAGRPWCRQGGMEQLSGVDFPGEAARLREEALALTAAPPCPAATTDLLLGCEQMVLQLHESVGHPLELDRILGDERNYAGTSFVTPEMFGTYRYGSPLLNVTFDPEPAEEIASYAFDDHGSVAQRQTLIRDGVLERPLGGALSQARSGLAGVASARACNWNRPPIDRMANLNMEPGALSRAALIAGIERGLFMTTTSSWSIDEARNKFQFGCEYGRLIENGELTTLVRNSGYRGVSATFWRSLTGVGDAETLAILGTPHCGKGEPNQEIAVGHAAPWARFSQVDLVPGS